jgi:transposase
VAGKRNRPARTSGVLPNFLIIGAMRCGTTSLARYLGTHPDVFVAPQKEVHFFDRNSARGLEWYAGQFSGATIERAVGEATQTYMYEDEAIHKVAETLPDARLIALLRDPVDRAYSHYWLNRSLGSEPLDFAQAVAAEPERVGSGDPARRRTYSYIDRGDYLRQLLHVCEHYPRSSLLVLLFEELRDRPEDIFRSVCRFLEIDDGFVPPNLGIPVNRYDRPRSRQLRKNLNRLPRTIRRVAGRLNARRASYPPMDPSVRDELGSYFRERNAALESWLGLDLPWRTE